MDNGKPTLRDIAQLASDRHDGKRGRALDRVAKKNGLKFSYTTFDRILSGTYTSEPSASTLDALALLSGVPVRDVYVAAGLPVPMSPFADQLPPDVDLMTGSQREAVLAVVRQFAAANRALRESERGEEHADARSPATKTPDPGPAEKPGMTRNESDLERLTKIALAAPASGGDDDHSRLADQVLTEAEAEMQKDAPHQSGEGRRGRRVRKAGD